MKFAVTFKKLLTASLLFILFRNRYLKIPFNKRKAMKHVVSLSLLKEYINAFKRFRSASAGNKLCFENWQVADSETYNRDSIIALLNAPGAASLRIYYGIKPGRQGDVLTTCLLPVDSQGNDIETVLVRTFTHPPDGSLTAPTLDETSIQPAMLMSAPVADSVGGAAPAPQFLARSGTSTAQGLDDSQRQP